ncbi:Uncharacterized membrane-anchored protein [Chitinophaga jiangningensis]|uniref:Uncharacterized membrane-anchored protein n=1 Tax=Chitinophaga jiangningensis TaxID=1419482 RepID=A0A1M6YL76_9BACT|nr:DUF2167 domain-containing protein [Chitinophaga jiangningensis]SHL18835.1 Uncharacterized membrane-anchored protein [Chitinophaga jiangningensis]
MRSLCWVVCLFICQCAVAAVDPDSELSAFSWQTKSQVLTEGHMLRVPDGFRFLNRRDSYKLLHDCWHNEVHPGLQGMLVPENVDLLSAEAWGATIVYENSGYLAEADALKMDYDQLLDARRKDHPGQQLQINWLVTPYYDPAAHVFHWPLAYQKNAGGGTIINYELRFLMRHGQLCFNIFGNKSSVGKVMEAVPVFARALQPAADASYTAFNIHTDKLAEWMPHQALGTIGTPDILQSIYNSWLFVVVCLLMVLFVYTMQFIHQRRKGEPHLFRIDEHLN